MTEEVFEEFISEEAEAERLSEIIERDSRRYSRAFTEEEQVKLKWK